MADIESVINGLECCYQINQTECFKCPYARGNGCTYALMGDALALLKAKRPVKPIIQRGWYRCGYCRNGIASVVDTGKPSHQQAYCDMCGREVKWE